MKFTFSVSDNMSPLGFVCPPAIVRTHDGDVYYMPHAPEHCSSEGSSLVMLLTTKGQPPCISELDNDTRVTVLHTKSDIRFGYTY